ncbi:hypothetical protein D9M70_487200 [compost metagenome]
MLAAFAGIDADQQAMGAGVDLFQHLLQFANLRWFRIHHQLIAVGAYAAFVAEYRLDYLHNAFGSAIVQRDDLRARRRTCAQC